MADAPARSIRIALLDDHALFRESVARLLAAEPEFEVVAAWGSMEEALGKLLSEPVDIVLLDFDLGQRDGAQFLRSARERGYAGKVLVVTAGVEKEEAEALIRSGISGIFTKNNSAALLAEGIRDVMAGKLGRAAIRAADTHERGTRIGHDGFHVSEVHVDDTRNRDEIRDALHALAQNIVNDGKGLE